MSKEGAIKVPKLIRVSNYEIWAIRIKAALIAKDLAGFFTRAEGAKSTKDDIKALSYIQLACQDGPLMHISTINNPLDAQKYLERLYAPKGFSSEFILFKEFFGATLTSISNIEDYLGTIKRVSTSLKAKNLELPNKLIIAWTLYNLDHKYEGFIASITQTYRAETADINMDTLFADLINESRRMDGLDLDDYESALAAKTRKPLRAKCQGCGKTGHAKETYYKLHPELRHQPRSAENNASPITNILFTSHSDLIAQ